MRRFCALAVLTAALGCGASSVVAEADVTRVQKAVEAYLFGYPLVTFDLVRQQNTNVAEPRPEQAPAGQLIKMRTYPAVANHCCAAPNADTLYTMAWFDLSKEPWLVSVPDMGDRYYILPFLDGWSEVFHVSSQPLNGGDKQVIALTGPGWKGKLPNGVTEAKSSTAMVWMLGRIYATGTDEDYDLVHKLQDAFDLRPLSAWGKDWVPPKGTVDPKIDMKTAVRKQVNVLDTDAFFDRLAALMVANPPHHADARMLATLKEIGIVPGEDFDGSAFTADAQAQLKDVPKRGLSEAQKRIAEAPHKNGWVYFTTGVGNWGTDYTLRAGANLLGPGWNRASDAIYPISQRDAQGNAYDASKQDYVIRFEDGQLPPADAFWSLTIYDKDMFFIPNAIDRYALGSHTPLTKGDDGSVEILIRTSAPSSGPQSNWLPAPNGPFTLVLRLYDPATTAPSILDASWTPPSVNRAK
jgi:hypothetical protein